MTLSDIELALSKIQDIGGKRHAARLLYAATPRFGSAHLASGSVTVPASWVTANSMIVATPQDTPGAGGQIYVKPADIIAGTSFKIRSSDGTDARFVYWMGIANAVGTGHTGS